MGCCNCYKRKNINIFYKTETTADFAKFLHQNESSQHLCGENKQLFVLNAVVYEKLLIETQQSLRCYSEEKWKKSSFFLDKNIKCTYGKLAIDVTQSYTDTDL